MGFSTTFEPAGKYAGLSGFPTGFTLGENFTTPLRQQPSSASSSSSFDAGSYYADLKKQGLPDSLIEHLVTQKVSNENNPEFASTSLLKEIYTDINNPARRKEILDQQLAYDKARMKEAFPYLMAREIPRQISEGFSNQAALTVLGARSAVDAMNETMRARTPLAFASAPYQSQKYFS